MEIELGIGLVQAHQLALTPQMKMSLHLLQLPLMELAPFLQQQIIENPVFDDGQECGEPPERELEQEPSDAGDDSEQAFEKLLDLDEGGRTYDRRLAYNGRPSGNIENVPAEGPNLYEHLLEQLNFSAAAGPVHAAADAIINHLDKDGCLRTPTAHIAQELNLTVNDIEEGLALVQSFSPAGVGARDLKECFLLQLKRCDKDVSLIIELLENHFDDLERRRFDKISRDMRVPQEELKGAFESLSHLDMSPGSVFTRDENSAVIPDISLYVDPGDKNGYRLEFNNEGMPSLHISSFYRRIMADPATTDETKRYLREKFNQAVWLMKALYRREDTVHRVFDAIFAFQQDFLEAGPGAIKPLTLKDIAQKIDMSESTVSRTIANKYVDTPHGIFPLKRFFDSSVKKTEGDVVSSKSVKGQIEELISEEQSPLTDDAIAARMKANGVHIARRTVAKYRQQLKILPSHLRRF
jgi:RNA polymerase sigma-54 factor